MQTDKKKQAYRINSLHGIMINREAIQYMMHAAIIEWRHLNYSQKIQEEKVRMD